MLWVASDKYFATHLVCNEIHLFINSHLISENTHKRVCKKKTKKQFCVKITYKPLFDHLSLTEESPTHIVIQIRPIWSEWSRVINADMCCSCSASELSKVTVCTRSRTTDSDHLSGPADANTDRMTGSCLHLTPAQSWRSAAAATTPALLWGSRGAHPAAPALVEAFHMLHLHCFVLCRRRLAGSLWGGWGFRHDCVLVLCGEKWSIRNQNWFFLFVCF